MKAQKLPHNTCQKCGAKNNLEFQYCTECGNKLYLTHEQAKLLYNAGRKKFLSAGMSIFSLKYVPDLYKNIGIAVFVFLIIFMLLFVMWDGLYIIRSTSNRIVRFNRYTGTTWRAFYNQKTATFEWEKIKEPGDEKQNH